MSLKLDPIDAYLTITRESGTRARVLNHLYSGDDFGDEHALASGLDAVLGHLRASEQGITATACCHPP